MKFNNILSEALIDDLKIRKIEKAVLRKFNDSDVSSSDEVYDISKEYGMPLHVGMSLYYTYLKYKDFLFNEEGIDIVKEYDVFSKENKDITTRIILEYIEKNYVGKTIYNSDGITGLVEFWEPIDIMVEEGMNPNIEVTMPVNGEYISSRGTTHSSYDSTFLGSLGCNITPWTTNEGEQKMGYDFITIGISEETFADWQQNVAKNGKYDDVLNGYLNMKTIGKPKNYSDDEIKRYCDRWIMIQQRIIKKATPILLSYKDYVEEGDSIFTESTKRSGKK
jgi:hypothetical protein